MNTYLARRPLVLAISKIIALTIGQSSLVQAAPFHPSTFLFSTEKDSPKDTEDPSLWLYLTTAAILVLLGGAFAGLTIALMGQVGAAYKTVFGQN
jgi:metal transporter CNNM